MIDAERHALIRGRIIKMLAKEYPNGMDLALLRRCLANINIPLSSKDLYAYVTYLKEVGYLGIEVKKWGDESLEYAKATTRGLNFIDDRLTEPDPGVMRDE
ncbi:MAG: hypothetical protein LBH05_02450 [Deferribacteraceae bacterium]|jgi:hypothetical protein|nr:hypothetical protein [Deferribacteraceae bacterium]